MKRYWFFIAGETLDPLTEVEGKVTTNVLLDDETKEQFKAKIIVSSTPQEGYDEMLVQLRSHLAPKPWYVKVVEREEEEEEITIFESARLGARRGHMLRSMLTEKEADEVKTEVMQKELEARRKQRQDIVKKVLGEGKEGK